MKWQLLRIIIPLAILALAGIAFMANVSLGTLSSFGWEDISVICPVGALGTMLASKTVVSRAVISLVLAIAAIFLLGRAFCGLICPIPVWSKIRNLFKRQSKPGESDKTAALEPDNTPCAKPLTNEERALLKKGCGARTAENTPANSRYIALAGALLSTAVFGFPVFCLICPVGLSFAGVFVLILLFGTGDLSWSVVAIPVLLALEIVFFRKWCSHICPLSAFMSLIARFNRTLKPAIDEKTCLETAHGAKCSRCTAACEVGIDLHHPEQGTSLSECTRCMKCIEVCPTKAISMPFVSRGQAMDKEALASASSDVDDDGTNLP